MKSPAASRPQDEHDADAPGFNRLTFAVDETNRDPKHKDAREGDADPLERGLPRNCTEGNAAAKRGEHKSLEAKPSLEPSPAHDISLAKFSKWNRKPPTTRRIQASNCGTCSPKSAA